MNDLIIAAQNKNWYKAVRGVGPTSAQRIIDKLVKRFIGVPENSLSCLKN
ncbi:MAG: hypothetical protein LIV24_09230 [Eubacterium sp.]|nr:hypothetical protein [Eubacterium sp.]